MTVPSKIISRGKRYGWPTYTGRRDIQFMLRMKLLCGTTTIAATDHNSALIKRKFQTMEVQNMLIPILRMDDACVSSFSETSNIDDTWMKSGELISWAKRRARRPLMLALTHTTSGTLTHNSMI